MSDKLIYKNWIAVLLAPCQQDMRSTTGTERENSSKQ